MEKTIGYSNEENLKNRDTYAGAFKVPAKALAIEPFDREWGVGLSGNTPDPSPFDRINRILSVKTRMRSVLNK